MFGQDTSVVFTPQLEMSSPGCGVTCTKVSSDPDNYSLVSHELDPSTGALTIFGAPNYAGSEVTYSLVVRCAMNDPDNSDEMYITNSLTVSHECIENDFSAPILTIDPEASTLKFRTDNEVEVSESDKYPVALINI